MRSHAKSTHFRIAPRDRPTSRDLQHSIDQTVAPPEARRPESLDRHTGQGEVKRWLAPTSFQSRECQPWKKHSASELSAINGPMRELPLSRQTCASARAAAAAVLGVTIAALPAAFWDDEPPIVSGPQRNIGPGCRDWQNTSTVHGEAEFFHARHVSSHFPRGPLKSSVTIIAVSGAIPGSSPSRGDTVTLRILSNA